MAKFLLLSPLSLLFSFSPLIFLAVCCGGNSNSKVALGEKTEAAVSEYYIVNTDVLFFDSEGAFPMLGLTCRLRNICGFEWLLRVFFILSVFCE